MFTELNRLHELENARDLDRQDTATLQQDLPVIPETPTRTGESNDDWNNPHAAETSSLFVKTPPPRSPVCRADVDSLHVKTPPESPVLSAIDHKADSEPEALLGDTESIPQALDQMATTSQSLKTQDDAQGLLPVLATDSVLGKRKVQDVDQGGGPKAPRG